MSTEEQPTREELMRELQQFKIWSGPKIAKVFRRTSIPGYELEPIGSGGFIKYRGKYFLLTNAHVINTIRDGDVLENIVVSNKKNNQRMNFIRYNSDDELDIAVLELDPMEAQNDSGRLFIDQRCFEEATKYINYNNIAFVHGFPRMQTEVYSEGQQCIAETTSFPYLTFIREYISDYGLISLYYSRESNIDEYFSPVQLYEPYGLVTYN